MFLRVHDVSTSAWCWLEASVDQYCLFLWVHDVSTGAWSWLEASVDPPQLTCAAVCSTAFLTMLVSSVRDNLVQLGDWKYPLVSATSLVFFNWRLLSLS